MPIYLIETPTAKRIIKARTQRSAIDFALRSDITIKPLSAMELANAITEEGLKIEQSNVDHEEVDTDIDTSEEE